MMFMSIVRWSPTMMSCFLKIVENLLLVVRKDEAKAIGHSIVKIAQSSEFTALLISVLTAIGTVMTEFSKEDHLESLRAWQRVMYMASTKKHEPNAQDDAGSTITP